jgi:hypothetical protein
LGSFYTTCFTRIFIRIIKIKQIKIIIMSNKITVSAMVNAEKSIVWDCYTNPKHIVHWNFADPSWHCPHR